jgi:hypothetical protein
MGAAVSAPGLMPSVVSYEEARRACEKAGKRLCSSEEWVSACQGARARDDDGDLDWANDYIEGTQYPYADWYEPGACRDNEESATAVEQPCQVVRHRDGYSRCGHASTKAESGERAAAQCA